MTQANGAELSFFSELYVKENVLRYYVSGEWKETTSGKLVPILNPTTEQKVFFVQSNHNTEFLLWIMAMVRLQSDRG